MVNGAIKLKCLASTEMMSCDWNMPCTPVQTQLKRKEEKKKQTDCDMILPSSPSITLRK